jgi:hypothetical protein
VKIGPSAPLIRIGFLCPALERGCRQPSLAPYRERSHDHPQSRGLERFRRVKGPASSENGCSSEKDGCAEGRRSTRYAKPRSRGQYAERSLTTVVLGSSPSARAGARRRYGESGRAEPGQRARETGGVASVGGSAERRRYHANSVARRRVCSLLVGAVGRGRQRVRAFAVSPAVTSSASGRQAATSDRCLAGWSEGFARGAPSRDRAVRSRRLLVWPRYLADIDGTAALLGIRMGYHSRRIAHARVATTLILR